MNADVAVPTSVLAVLGSEGDLAALDAARTLADHYAASIDVFTCIQPPHDLRLLASLAGRSPDRLVNEITERRRKRICEMVASALPGRAVEVHMRDGTPFVEVIRFVIDHGIDFVIKGAGPLGGVRRFLFGSTDQHLLRKCPCPVWLVYPDARPAPRTVLAAVDLDEENAAEPATLAALNRRVVATALRMAEPAEAQVIVMHAWDANGDGLAWAFPTTGDADAATARYEREVESARAGAMDALLAAVEGSARPTPRLVRGIPDRVIRDQSRLLGADVVVMGTVARTGLSGVIIGNTAENIINGLECPVIAVKPEGFVSPVAIA